MQTGQQVFPHKYLKRVLKRGKWVYVYRDDNKPADLAQFEQHMVVIAHQKPTPILVDRSNSIIAFGPPQTIGKQLFRNTNPAKQRFGIAKNLDGSGAVYFYPESMLATIKAKQSAKYIRAQRAIELVDITAERLLREPYPEDQQYGMALWLNNHTRLRIGAHESAASVDAVERRGIINQARVEGWSDKAKETALQSSRKQTFGLLTSRVGHISIDPMKRTASWHFRGKGGKMITDEMVHVNLPPLQYAVLSNLLHNKPPDTKVFPDVIYKVILNYYHRFGITPHAVRGAYANSEIKKIVAAFIAEKPTESPSMSMTRLRKEIKEKVSDRLGHSVDMTLKAYVSDTTRKAVQEAAETIQPSMQESFQIPETPYGVSLAQVFVWMEVGPGNEVV